MAPQLEITKDGVKTSYLRFLADAASGLTLLLVVFFCLSSAVGGFDLGWLNQLYLIAHEAAPDATGSDDDRGMRFTPELEVPGEVAIAAFVLALLCSVPIGLALNALSWFLLGGAIRVCAATWHEMGRLVRSFAEDQPTKLTLAVAGFSILFFVAYLVVAYRVHDHLVDLLVGLEGIAIVCLLFGPILHTNSYDRDEIWGTNWFADAHLLMDILTVHFPAIELEEHIYGIEQYLRSQAIVAFVMAAMTPYKGVLVLLGVLLLLVSVQLHYYRNRKYLKIALALDEMSTVLDLLPKPPPELTVRKIINRLVKIAAERNRSVTELRWNHAPHQQP